MGYGYLVLRIPLSSSIYSTDTISFASIVLVKKLYPFAIKLVR